MRKRIAALLLLGTVALAAALTLLLREEKAAPVMAPVTPGPPLATFTPMPTATPTPVATPTPTAEPTAAPRSEAWFGAAVFVGDSVTRALENHNRRSGELGEALFLCEVSLSVRNLVEGIMGVWYGGEERSLPEALAAAGASRMFIMLGTNDVALPGGIGAAMKNWAALLDAVREQCPDMEIYVQSVLPMYSAGQMPDLNNRRLAEYNRRLQALCQEKGCRFLDLAPWFADADGGLRQEYCSDAYVHLTEAGAALWASLLLGEEIYEAA